MTKVGQALPPANPPPTHTPPQRAPPLVGQNPWSARDPLAALLHLLPRPPPHPSADAPPSSATPAASGADPLVCARPPGRALAPLANSPTNTHTPAPSRYRKGALSSDYIDLHDR